MGGWHSIWTSFVSSCLFLVDTIYVSCLIGFGFCCDPFIMRHASEASLFFLGFPRKKKTLHNGSYEHRVPKIKIIWKKNTLFCTRYVGVGVCMCVVQHRSWPLRSTILNAHGTNAGPDGLCTRTHTNEAFSCSFCCKSFSIDRAWRVNVCLEAWLGRGTSLVQAYHPKFIQHRKFTPFCSR